MSLKGCFEEWRVGVSRWASVFFILVLVLVASCLSGPDISIVEQQRIASPLGQWDAVVVRSDGGATTSFGYHVCVVEKGDGADIARSVLTVNNAVTATPLGAVWLDESHLQVTCRSGQLIRKQASVKVGSVVVAVSIRWL